MTTPPHRRGDEVSLEDDSAVDELLSAPVLEAKKDDGPRIEVPKWAKQAGSRINSLKTTSSTSADDILARWDQTAHHRDAIRERATSGSVVRRGAAALLLIGAAWMGSSTFLASTNYDNQRSANAQAMGSLHHQIDGLKDTKANVPTTKQISNALQDAYTSGKKIADFQTWLTSSPSDYQAVGDRTNAIAKSFSSDAIMGTQPWFVPSTTWMKSKKEIGTPVWTFSVPYSFSSNAQLVNVVWECRDQKSHKLLAWALGQYSVSTGTFTAVQFGPTADGAALLGGTDEADPKALTPVAPTAASSPKASTKPSASAKSSPSAKPSSSAKSSKPSPSASASSKGAK